MREKVRKVLFRQIQEHTTRGNKHNVSRYTSTCIAVRYQHEVYNMLRATKLDTLGKTYPV
jgi:hypothetical protein